MIRWVIAATATAAFAVQTPRVPAIWVLHGPDRIVEYDGATFAARRSVTAPAHVVAHPEHLSVNAAGQLLYAVPSGLSLGGATADDNRVWLWDEKALTWPRDTAPDVSRQWFLSAAGDALFALETRRTIERDRDGGERGVQTATRWLRTDLAGAGEQTLITLPALPSCACETGACSETCPIWTAWAPDGTVGEFFLATRLVEGQLQPDYQETVIYRRDAARWSPQRLATPVEAPLAASADASVLAAAAYDSGCCGWINESSDRLLLVQRGASTGVYDEWARFNNRNYDASFRPAGARFNQASRLLAYTIAADVPPAGEELRLSADGKPDAVELARIRAAAADQPSVEIVDLQSVSAARVIIRRTALVGWLGADRLLVAESGRLVVYDTRGAKQRETNIQVRRAADAFLR